MSLCLYSKISQFNVTRVLMRRFSNFHTRIDPVSGKSGLCEHQLLTSKTTEMDLVSDLSLAEQEGVSGKIVKQVQ